MKLYMLIYRTESLRMAFPFKSHAEALRRQLLTVTESESLGLKSEIREIELSDRKVYGDSE